MKFNIKQLQGDIPYKNLIYILGAIGLLLILLSSFVDDKPQQSVEEPDTDYCIKIEKRLEEILPNIAGVGKVNVMVTAKNYGKITLAKDEKDNSRQTVVLNQKGGGEDAKIIEENYPEIQGVIIVASGGGNDIIKERLTEATVALLGVEAHKVRVFEKESNK